jgi:cation transport protein ChaC
MSGTAQASDGEGELWVFGYGSLMWDPGFPHIEALRARLAGYHRAFCIYSWHYRGTQERPGLVLGLAPGGACVGRAFRVHAEEAGAVRAYLWDREMRAGRDAAYIDRVVPLTLDGGARVEALTHVALPSAEQYAGDLPLEEAARLIAQGSGTRGRSLDYLRNTARHLAELEIDDRRIAGLLDRAEALATDVGD